MSNTVNIKEKNLAKNLGAVFKRCEIYNIFTKSSVAFAMMWIFTGTSSLYLLGRSDYTHHSLPGITLIVASIYCFISAAISLTKYLSPYIVMEKDYMTLKYSVLNSYKIPYDNIRGTTYKNEIVGLVTYDGQIYNVNLSHITEESQRSFLTLLKNRMDFVRGIVSE